MSRTSPKASAGRPAVPRAAAHARPREAERATRVLRRFRQIFNAVRTHFQSVEKAAGIGGAQLWALSTIGERPGIGVNDLALAMDIHQSTASNLVRTLSARNLIAVSRHGSDRRAVQLEVLAAGRAILRKAPAPFTGVLPRAVHSLDSRVLARLDKDLATLIDALGADEQAAGIPLAQLMARRRVAAGPRRARSTPRDQPGR